MVFKIFYVISLLICILNLISCKSTKCCLENQILNSTFNGCVNINKNRDIINFNISDFNSDASFYNISSKNVINLSCDIKEVKVLMSSEYEISENLTLSPKLVRGAENFNSSEYCLDDAVDGNSKVALTCPCLRGTCVHVCCEPGYVVDQRLDVIHERRLNCVPADEDEWTYWRLENSTIVSEHQLYHTLYNSDFKCKNSEPTTISTPGNITLLPNGYLREFLAEFNESFDFHPSEYCIGAIKFFNNTDVNMILCTLSPEEVNVVTMTLYIILFIIGALFLSATLVVYLMLPELQRSVQGLSLMSHCACMLIAHIALIIVQLVGATVVDAPCKILAYLIQISLLAGFFWMNVMCIDISSKFRQMRTAAPSVHEETQKFLHYSIYAIGVPFLIFFITIAVDSSDNVAENIKPGIGNGSCWFSKETQGIVIYFYGPIGLLLVINFLLFIFTTRKIVTFSRGTSILQRGNGTRHNQRQSDTKSIVLFLKLFGLMGIPWVMEIISWAVGGKDYYWYLTDAFNLLRSVFIFIMFCCKKKVKKLLQARHPWIFTAILHRNTQESSSSDQRDQANNSTLQTPIPESDDTINLTPMQNKIQEENGIQNSIE